jgi:diguanylate cyclase (GGDEF)-like protein
MELLYFYLFDYAQVSFFLRTGVLLFVAILSVQSVSRIGNLRRKIFQAELYEKLAFTDQLTKAPNRMAFDRDLYVLFQKPPAEYVYVGFYDLNNLKLINDRYGHKYGDDAIIRSYGLIQDVFSRYGSCYRIGGDEFACVLRGPDKGAIDLMADKLNEEAERINRDLFYPFVLAQGYAELDRRKQTSVDELMHEADKNMYLDKTMKKNDKPLPPSLQEPVSLV